MARNYAQIFCAIWDDEDFCALSSDAQRTYFMLITQDDITAAGTLALRVRRWSRTLPESDRDRLIPSIDELIAAGMVFVDEDTEELLVRSFIKHDGGYRHSKRVVAVVAYAQATKSRTLLAILASELDRLDVSHGITVPPDTQLNANPVPLQSLRVVVTERSEDTTTQKPETGEPAAKPAAARERARRITEDWQPTPENVEWARGKGMDDAFQRRHTERFRNHFLAAGGSNAVKRDWSRAWMNWFDTEQDRAAPTAARPTAEGMPW